MVPSLLRSKKAKKSCSRCTHRGTESQDGDFVLIWRKAKDPSEKKTQPEDEKKKVWKNYAETERPKTPKLADRASANLKSKSRSLSLSLSPPPFLRLKSQTLAVAVDERSTRSRREEEEEKLLLVVVVLRHEQLPRLRGHRPRQALGNPPLRLPLLVFPVFPAPPDPLGLGADGWDFWFVFGVFFFWVRWSGRRCTRGGRRRASSTSPSRASTSRSGPRSSMRWARRRRLPALSSVVAGRHAPPRFWVGIFWIGGLGSWRAWLIWSVKWSLEWFDLRVPMDFPEANRDMISKIDLIV